MPETPRLIASLRKVCSPYNVNGIALAVLPEALADEAYLDWYVGEVKAGRERIYTALDEMGVRYWRSAANFVLMDIGAKHKELVGGGAQAWACCCGTARPTRVAMDMCA